ncbi:hypothetical protein [Embleya sp. NBC_00896]|uniref:hypothetical protein n=1 Tax=Embleya sp. NBC_00896 TaxID=2975961 RepID=UPI00386536AC|nr:hypothetical protein OG928_28585 [Embleya sp. NBC_00896]
MSRITTARGSAVGVLLTFAMSAGLVVAGGTASATPGTATTPPTQPNQPTPPAATAGPTGTDVPDADRGSPGQGASSIQGRALAGPSAATKMTRADVIARADSWVGIGLEYSWTTTYQGYRTDCSGFASMAWKLAKPGLDTTSFGPSGVTIGIGKGMLRPGDALLNEAPGAYGHIVLFDTWVDGSQSSYWGYEFSGSGMHYRKVPYPYFAGYGTFLPVRNLGIVDDPSTPLDLSGLSGLSDLSDLSKLSDLSSLSKLSKMPSLSQLSNLSDLPDLPDLPDPSQSPAGVPAREPNDAIAP